MNPIRKVQLIGTFPVIGCFLFSKTEEISFVSFYKRSFYIFIYFLNIITKATKKTSREWMNNLIDKLSCHSYITVSTERDIRKYLMVRCCDPKVIMTNSSYNERVFGRNCSYKQSRAHKVWGLPRAHVKAKWRRHAPLL